MPPMTRAFVLGGGGKWGAVQVGMLHALVARGLRPDLVIGCSIGSVNGACVAADPTPAGIDRLERLWVEQASSLEIRARLRDRVRSFVGRRPYLYEPDAIRSMAVSALGDRRFGDLAVPFQCVAASIEGATERWFDEGMVVDALMASSAIPGLFPAVELDGEHFYDGGLVNSIPLDRAVALGATEVFVLQVGRVEQALAPPRRLYEAPMVAFEIARRHRFATFLAGLPDGVAVHVLPSGHQLAMDDRRQLAWRRLDDPRALIDGARRATTEYLERLALAPPRTGEG